MRTYAAALTPPPPVYAMRTHWPRPPSPSVRTYFMDDPLIHNFSWIMTALLFYLFLSNVTGELLFPRWYS